MNERVQLSIRSYRRRRGGQTLVIALIVLGVLLILGFVFLGLVDRSLHNQSVSQSRSESNDLAEAGIRYAHSQLLTSELGADYRGTPSLLPSNTPLSSADPDLLYLRPAPSASTTLSLRSATDTTLADMGGPDGLGPFVRINFAQGRALVRIRYAPSDANLFVSSPMGALRNPGAARDYLIIESVGRTGVVIANDPTTLSSRGAIQYTGFNNWNAYHTAFQLMQQSDGQLPTSRRLIAMQAIGITEQAMFITNINHVNRPAEIGIPSNLGATYTKIDPITNVVTPIAVGPNQDFANPTSSQSATFGGRGLAQQFGGSTTLPNTSGVPVTGIPGSGGLRSNADLAVYGNVILNLNQSLGEGVSVNGTIIPIDNSQLIVNRSFRDANGNWQSTGQTVVAGPSFDSRKGTFDTQGGAIRDGVAQADANGFPRSVGYEQPPSLAVVDEATGQNRYVEATKDSGVLFNGVNTGNYGYGRGVYVNNTTDRQNPSDETGREVVGGQQSLVHDMLNPNNGMAGSAWQGPFYVPVGAYVQLVRDGFIIQRRDQRWQNPDGTDSGQSVIRYRLGRGSDEKLHIINTFTSGVNIADPNLDETAFDKGFVFNGVLYFDGNVRIRGYIPTDVQLMLVSNASIFIEGSLQKSDVETQWTKEPDNAQIGDILKHAPKATLMLAAKDYVVVNTSMFFGPSPSQVLQAVNDVPNDQAVKPIDLKADGSLEFIHELAMSSEPTAQHPEINPSNPSTWVPYATQYVDAVTPSKAITPKLTVLHTMDDGPAATTFVSLLVNYTGDANQATYAFGTSSSDYSGIFNSAYGLNGNTTGPFAMWGLGSESWQRYPKFEADSFNLIGTGTTAFSSDGLSIAAASGAGTFQLHSRETNDFLIQPKFFAGTPTNDYLLGRVFMAPDDVKIEASMFAEQGSFFVLPGDWVNSNPNDRHDKYPTLGSNGDEQARARLEFYGSNPEFPFYGEPCDVRITISGAITQNMPVPIAEQAEWLRKWGWIPNHRGSNTTDYLPAQHVPALYDATRDAYVPNLIINYDPVLATASNNGYAGSLTNAIRVDDYNRVLPPIPRLPVSPALAYFGEVN